MGLAGEGAAAVCTAAGAAGLSLWTVKRKAAESYGGFRLTLPLVSFGFGLRLRLDLGKIFLQLICDFKKPWDKFICTVASEFV